MTGRRSKLYVLCVIVLALIVGLLLVACGEKDEPRHENNQSEVTPTENKQEATPTTEPDTPTAAPDTPTTEPDVPTSAPYTPTPTPVPDTPTPEPATPTPEVPTPTEKPSVRAWDDIGYDNTYGRIAYADGYTWFVQGGNNGDGSVNGSMSTDDIYRIADGDNAQPERMASVPSVFEAGTEQATVYYLMPYGDTVYFLSRDMGVNTIVLRALDVPTATMRDTCIEMPSTLSNYVCRKGNTMYFLAYSTSSNPDDFDEDGDYIGLPIWQTIAIDMEAGTVSEFALQEKGGAHDILVLNGIDEEYVYFIKYTEYDESETCVQMRYPAGGGQAEEILSISPDFDNFPRVLDGILFSDESLENDGEEHDYYVITNLVERSNAAVGKEYARLDMDTLFDDSMYTFLDGNLYYIVRDAQGGTMYRKNLAEDSEAQKMMSIPEDMDEPLFTVQSHWLYCLEEDEFVTCRTKLDAKVLSIVPIVDSEEGPERRTDASGKWEYCANSRAVCITDYFGEGGEVTVPAEINGTPVRIVSYWMPSSREVVVTKMVIPDGVVSLELIEDRNIEELYIPASVKHFTFHGVQYTINIKDGGKVYYAGTMEQWKRLADDNADRYSSVTVDTSGTVNLTIVCTDGELSDWED